MVSLLLYEGASGQRNHWWHRQYPGTRVLSPQKICLFRLFWGTTERQQAQTKHCAFRL